MRFLIALACSLAFAAAFKKPLKRFPVLFYALAVAIDLLFVASSFGVMPKVVRTVTFVLAQRCTVATALFMVVAFIGVFRKDSRVRLHFMPVRAELSIIACILALGHVVLYLASYGATVLAGHSIGSSFVATALVLASVLTMLLVVLGVTSFQFVKRRMTTKAWKAVQKWAYLFYALIYVHLMFMLGPSTATSTTSLMNVATYTLVFGAYGILRVRRALIDRKAEAVALEPGATLSASIG